MAVSSQTKGSAVQLLVHLEHKLERFREAAERVRRAHDFLEQCREAGEVAQLCGATRDAREGFEQATLELLAIIE